jgi:PiT family inorganic phosphate transporter
MLTHLDPTSMLAVGLLVFSLAMVLMFEATNGFHDAANAVATVIYTKSLQPTAAVVWSGMMNFVGVLVGGIAVAYALVELLPAEVLSPPDGGPAVAMLIALLASALFWNILTWWLGLPNSSRNRTRSRPGSWGNNSARASNMRRGGCAFDCSGDLSPAGGPSPGIIKP